MVVIKHRYILSQLEWDGKGQAQIKAKCSDIYHTIMSAVSTAHGSYGHARVQSSLAVKHFRQITCTAMIRVKRDSYQLVLTAMAFIKCLLHRPNESVFFRTLHVAGSMRSCQKFLVKYHREYLTLMLHENIPGDVKEKVRESLTSSARSKAAKRKRMNTDDD